MDQDAGTAASGTQVTYTMQKKNLLASALVAFCVIGMLALPASAAPTVTGTTAKMNPVDQGLKDDLWANHMQYRLARFDMNIEQANAVIAILDKYGIDTTQSQAALSTINGKRADLVAALGAKDREKLKTLNEELKTLWKQFLKDIREEVRSHYGKATGSSTAMNAVDSLGL